jgi:hypothetical protein
MTQAAKQVYETLLQEGAMNTIDLRRAAKLANAKDSEFNKAIEYLQSDFKVLPVGVSDAGAWKYSFIYEIVPRHYPELPEKARSIGENEARSKLIGLYFESVGAAQEKDAVKLFGWKKGYVTKAIVGLVEKRVLVESKHPKQKGNCYSLRKLASK